MNHKTKIIAEVGCNHQGQLDLAYKYIDTLKKECNVDYVKFQKRNPKELLTEEEYNAPHPNSLHSFGSTYGEHREFLEFPIRTHVELKKACEAIGVGYATSVWDLTSAKEIASIYPDYIKIPSACNLSFEMLEYLCHNYHGKIHLSLGMTTAEEELEILNFFKNKERLIDLIIYHCTSGYPITFKDANLLHIKTLQERYPNVGGYGFSSHTLGISIEPVAVSLGAQYIEKHVTFDRMWKGSDMSASLEIGQMKKLVRDIRATEDALQYKKQDLLNIEIPQRKKLKRLA
jgi:N-acetylneuraminate synthase